MALSVVLCPYSGNSNILKIGDGVFERDRSDSPPMKVVGLH